MSRATLHYCVKDEASFEGWQEHGGNKGRSSLSLSKRLESSLRVQQQLTDG